MAAAAKRRWYETLCDEPRFEPSRRFVHLCHSEPTVSWKLWTVGGWVVIFYDIFMNAKRAIRMRDICADEGYEDEDDNARWTFFLSEKYYFMMPGKQKKERVLWEEVDT